jgi:catechol 2,3-dioxygenase-like lactoylglutathione lyase family enzyme
VRPRKLGHAVLGSTDYAASTAFFTEGLGFKVSDRIKGVGAFMRCSTDHHNVLVLAAPVSFLHHTSWQVDDVDDVGRGAQAMLEGRPERHVWGLGRHYAGSNFFWYLKDPAGNFSEYYSDMDCIIDDQLWTPEDLEGARGLFAWGPPPPPSFLHPEDLAAMMTGAPLDPLNGAPLNRALVGRRHDQDRAVRVVDDLTGHRAHRQPGETAHCRAGPSTSMSAPWLALMSSSAGKPCTAVTVTEAGREPSAASTCSVSAWAASLALSVSVASSE